MSTEEENPQTSANDSEEITETPVRNLQSYYSHSVGVWQTVSLVLNAGLMIYAHVGLSGVILSNRDPSITSANGNVDNVVEDNNITNVENNTRCNDEDLALWISYGGEDLRPTHSNFCSRQYEGGCFTDTSCIADCFEVTYGYSADCATCFSTIPSCSVATGCTGFCAVDSLGKNCQACNVDCIAETRRCSGLPVVSNDTRRYLQEDNVCNEYDLDEIDTWYNVYDLTFVESIQDAWNGNAEILAIIVMVFSGIRPYAKNVILLIVWFVPMSIARQTSTILWLSRLSKYTLVDVFAVVAVLVGVQLQLNVGGTGAVTRAEPRFGIVAFFLATVWEFVQIEVIKGMHEAKVLKQDGLDAVDSGDKTKMEGFLFGALWIPSIVWLLSVGLYIGGGMAEIVSFTSTDSDADAGCRRSYNLFSLGTAMVNELSLTDNAAAGQTWILYLVYVLLNLIFPIVTHLLQFVLLFQWGQNQSTLEEIMPRLKRLSLCISAIWCFACIEVLLIGVFAVEFKFPELVSRIAGESNSVFLDITSGLGPGFYLLIAYSIVAGFLQFCLCVTPKNPRIEGASRTSQDNGV